MSPKISTPDFSRPSWSAFRQAWNIFVFSSMFAVLFNTFYVDGIELKYKPPKITQITSGNATPATDYAGWGKKAPKASSVQPAPTKPPYSDIIRLSLMGAKSRFDKKNSIFLDARKAEEYQAGHIPGSLDFSALEMDKFAPQVMPQLTDKNREMVVYCNGGDCTLSLELAQTLIEQGYTQVKVFEGGWPEWKKAAYPIQTGGTP